ncbi:MAG: hypothetical protein PHE56_14175 [Bacteroidales bacterium]|nr:hypothetical protein [Bacteroidales bacterium]
MRTKILIITALSIFVSLSALAQETKGGKNCPLDDEKIKAEKIAFITAEINLTVKEAQAFWPVYNEFTDKMDALFKEEHKITKEIKKNSATLSDKDLEAKLDRLVEIREERSKLEQTYHEKFKDVLPIKKVAKLYQADREFRKHLLQKYKDHPCAGEK